MTASKVAVLGSTGSIGTQTLEVIAAANAHHSGTANAHDSGTHQSNAPQPNAHQQDTYQPSADQPNTYESGTYEVVALSAASSTELLATQIEQFAPQQVAVQSPAAAQELRNILTARGTSQNTRQNTRQNSNPPEILCEPGSLAALAANADVVVNGVVGFAGLEITLATLKAGKRLALANKESLIAAGPLCQPLRSTPGAEIIPVDSEHCALHQCLNPTFNPNLNPHVSQLVLTASGGPFLGRSADELAAVTVKDALAHPTWQMGPKITVDSSTLMNKGLEVIEAHELFGVSYDQIDVVIHPQSVVHSMVTFTDGATLAQLSLPDMRLPIGYALAYPERLDTAFGAIDWAQLGTLEFATPDRQTFRCLDLAIAAGRMGETAPAWLNGANEAAVAAFLDGAIAWHQIAELISDALDAYDGQRCDSVEAVVAADQAGRNFVTHAANVTPPRHH